MRTISKDDWGRKQWFNQIVLAVSLFIIVIGTRHYEMFGGWKGVFLVLSTTIILLYQHNFLWKLIREKQSK